MLNILCVILAVALAFWLWRSRLGQLLVMTCFIGLLIVDSGQPLLAITLLAAGYLMSTLPREEGRFREIPLSGCPDGAVTASIPYGTPTCFGGPLPELPSGQEHGPIR